MPQEDKLIYCAARLFAVQDRLAIEIIANAITKCLKIARLDHYRVFLPFRDTSQDAVVTENKSHWIYEQDIRYLESAAVVLALVDGISKDDGVSMELGFAFGKGIPFVLCTSDFVWQESRDTANRFICDPCIDYFSAGKIAVNSSDRLDRTLPYHTAHLNLLELLSEEVGAGVVEILTAPKQRQRLTRIVDAKTAPVFVDIAGGRYAWCKLVENEIRNSCRFNNIVFGCRWLDGCSIAAIERDFHNLCTCRFCVVFGDAIEVDAGSAFLHGASVALGVPTALFYSRQSVIRGPGGQTMWRNLMLSESSTWQPTSLLELCKLIEYQTL